MIIIIFLNFDGNEFNLVLLITGKHNTNCSQQFCSQTCSMKTNGLKLIVA